MKGSATMTDINKEYEKEYYDEYRNSYYNPDDDDGEPGINLNWKRIQKGFKRVEGADTETTEQVSSALENIETLTDDVEQLKEDVIQLQTDVGNVLEMATQAAESAEQSAETAQAAAETAETVFESIPEDYSELSADVVEIKSDLNNIPMFITYNSATDIINGKFLRYNDGAEASAGTAHCTDFILISDYDSFHLVCSVLGLACGMVLYDDTKTFIASYYTQTTGDIAHTYNEYISKNYILSEHNNAVYVRFGSLYDLTVETGILNTATLDEFSLKVVDGLNNDFIASVFPPADDNVTAFSTVIDNTFIKYNNGETANAQGAHCTDFIVISDYIYFRLRCSALGLACGMAIYDTNQAFIASYFTQTTGDLQKHFDVAIYVHDILLRHPDAVFVRFGSLSLLDVKCNVSLPTKNILDVIGESNVLYSKKYYALGDSFTHGDWTGYDGDINDIYDAAFGVYKTYPYWIAKRNHMYMTNLAVNGSTIVSLVARGDYSAIPDDCDYATIMIGLNDTTNTENEPLGDIDITDTTTWYGCWNTIMAWLRSNRPHLHFGVLIVSSYMSETLREATRLVCAKYGYPYLDMYKDPKVPAFMGKYGMNQSISDALYNVNKQSAINGHPTLECQKFMSTFIESFIRQI